MDVCTVHTEYLPTYLQTLSNVIEHLKLTSTRRESVRLGLKASDVHWDSDLIADFQSRAYASLLGDDGGLEWLEREVHGSGVGQ